MARRLVFFLLSLTLHQGLFPGGADDRPANLKIWVIWGGQEYASRDMASHRAAIFQAHRMCH